MDSLKVQICSPTENFVTMIARGHPGNVVKCNETGIAYPSQMLCAIDNNINAASLSLHLRGLKENVKNLTFTKVGPATVVA